ncbi:MAG: hypothetical protein J2P15_20355 [Micromonosporaceae bacterium]|nr:hypothetical protein [Micromonosporaceae bacterium]
MSMLDELLSYGDDEPGEDRRPVRRRSRSPLWTVAKLVLYAGLGTLAIHVFNRLVGWAFPDALVFAVLLAAQGLRRTLRWLPASQLPATLLRAGVERGPVGPRVDLGEWTPRDGLHLAVTRWDTRLSWLRMQRDPNQFSRTVQPRLVELIDERLRLRHGVSRAADPDRARALLGDPLWTIVSGPASRPPTPREFAALVKQMEEV